MHVAFRFQGHVVVDDVGNAFHVDPAGREIGRHEQTHASATEFAERPGSGILRFIAVDRVGSSPFLVQLLGHAVGAALGTGEDQGAVDLGASHQPQQ